MSLARALGGEGGSAYEDSTHPWMCSGLQEVSYQVAFSRLSPLSPVSQAELLLAHWGTSYGDGHEGLELRVAAGFEMTSGIVKHNCMLNPCGHSPPHGTSPSAPPPRSQWRPWGQGQLIGVSGGARGATGEQMSNFF